MTFVKTTAGYVYGGYTSLNLTGSTYAKDLQSFLFSITKKRMFPAVNATTCPIHVKQWPGSEIIGFG